MGNRGEERERLKVGDGGVWMWKQSGRRVRREGEAESKRWETGEKEGREGEEKE